MKWKSIKRKKPPYLKKIWISYFSDDIYSRQQQTYAKVVGENSDEELLWHDFVTGEIINNNKITVTHWMETPDDPIINSNSF